MNKGKRIFGILMSFVMVFSIFAGNLSYAAGEKKVTSPTLKTTLKVNGKEETKFTDYGLKLYNENTKKDYDVKETETLIKGHRYTIKHSDKNYTLEKIEVKNAMDVKDFSFTADTGQIDLTITLKKNINIVANLEDTEDTDIRLFGLTIGNKTINEENKLIYLKNGEHEVKYNSKKYTLKEVNGKEFKNNKIEVTDETEKLEFDFVQGTSKVEFKANLTAPTEVKSKVSVKLNNNEYKLGENKILDKNKYTLNFTNIPNDYVLVLKESDGTFKEVTTQNNKASYEVSLFSDTELNFGVKHKDLQVLIDAPKTSSNNQGLQSFNVYTTPSTNVVVQVINTSNGKIIETIKAKIDLNGKAIITANADNIVLAGHEIKAYTESNNLVAENSVKVNSEKTTLEVKAEEISIGDKKITGTSTGTSVKAYVYNMSTKKFTELEEAKVSNGKFEIEHKTGFVNDDQVYIKAMNSKDEGIYTVLKTASSVERLAGSNRFVTAVKIARESYPKTDAVVIANGYISADALAAGPLANELNAPILLVEDDFVIQDVVSYIKESGAKKIYIAGGSASVSDKVVRNVKPSANTETERIYGSDRYETSLKIADKLVKNHDYKKSVIFANGLKDKDADALAASTYATQSKQAIILTRENATTDKVKTGLKTLGITSAEIVGGSASVSNKAVTDAGLTVGDRISGSNRYETSLEIAKKLENVNSIIIANGYKSADALASASLAKTKNAAILLSTENSITDSQTEFIKSKKPIGTIYIAGGNSSVFETLETSLEELIK